MTVRVYKSTDTGAPAHPSATLGSMAALLRACLVTGYGTQTAAGWEEPFTESSNYAVFRALSGARQFFQIDDNQADADVAAIYAFEAMSDVQTGTGQWVTSSDSYRHFGKRQNATDAYSTSWLVVADELTCYVFLNCQYGLIPFGFGEFQSYRDDNPYRSFIGGHGYTSGLPAGGYPTALHPANAVTTINGYLYVHRGMDYSARVGTSIVAPYSLPTGKALGGDNYLDDDAYSGFSYPVLPAMIGGGNFNAPYGQLRGMYAPCANQPKTHLEQFTHDEMTMLAVNFATATTPGYYGQFWIDITGSWA
ncbi:MAG: hypothetical protein RBS34_13880 [Desulfofustis sp.]|jgi:hypothetical protein|nr:hypothetical protein [Desulfofustis sp.]